MEIVVRRIAGWSPDLSHSELTELYHHGIKGQRWGVRRYQNPDGSLTAAGQKRYGTEHKRLGMDDYLKYETKAEKDTEKKTNAVTLATAGPAAVGMLAVAALPAGALTIPLFAGSAAVAAGGALVNGAIRRSGKKSIKEARESMSDAQKRLLKDFESNYQPYTKAILAGDKEAQNRIVKRGAVLRAVSREISKDEDVGKRYSVIEKEDGGYTLQSQHYNPKVHNEYKVNHNNDIVVKKKKSTSK